MGKDRVVQFCKELGCCDTCCLRYKGIKAAKSYMESTILAQKIVSSPSGNEESSTDVTKDIDANDENITTEDTDVINKTHNSDGKEVLNEPENSMDNESETLNRNGSSIRNATDNSNTDISINESENEITTCSEAVSGNNDTPPSKKSRVDVCPSCLGIMQEDLWMATFEMVKEELKKKRYDCLRFACALSSPIAIILREKAIALRLKDKFPRYDEKNILSLKESWKWSFGMKMADHIDMALDSGAVTPLLITLNYDYPDDMQELEILKAVSPKLFQSRSQQQRRFHTQFTKRSVEQALENVTLESLTAAGGGLPLATASAKCVSVVCNHNPIYLGGRYIKLSRNLPQSPWVLDGRRVILSSVQEIIFQPIADLYGFNAEEVEARLKFVSAGREDVDVRCLGDGRPFAIEITDPRRTLTAAELVKACEEISRSGDVIVKCLVPIDKNDLTQLKKGEETKCKTYEALCMKLTHSKFDEVDPESPITVTDEDIRRINEFRNTAEGDPWKIKMRQKTPIRVLHRRPLLTRTKGIVSLEAFKVPEHRQLIRAMVQTTAGAYVKEWVSGELGRSMPSLAESLRARADLLALDVCAVHLEWPPGVTCDNKH